MKGLVFGRYQVESMLGQGGMGEVYLAREQRKDQPVILKVLKKDLIRDPRVVLQFLDEIRISAQLHHPNVISVFDTGEWEGELVMAMEFIPGHDLSTMLRRAETRSLTEFPVGVAAQILADAASGLAYVHAAKDLKGSPLKVIHRDVSPQNLMVREDGLTKILDFGVARAEARAVRTLQGMVKGKLSYMAPEQVQGGELSGRADQFALGVVAWEMLTMQRLFRAERDVDTLQQVLGKVVVPPSTLSGHVPQALDAVVLRMLERDPALRYPSCEEAARELLPYAAGRDAVAAFQRALGLAPSPARRRAAVTESMEAVAPHPSPAMPPAQRGPPGLDRRSDAAPTEATRSLRPNRSGNALPPQLDLEESPATDRHQAMTGVRQELPAGDQVQVQDSLHGSETEGDLPRVTGPQARGPTFQRENSSPSISITEPAGRPRPGSGPNRTVILRSDADAPPGGADFPRPNAADARSTELSHRVQARARDWQWWHWALLSVGALSLGVGAALGVLRLLGR